MTHHHVSRVGLPTEMHDLPIEDVNHVEIPRELLQTAIDWLIETQA